MNLEERDLVACHAWALFQAFRSSDRSGVARFTPDQAVQLVAGAMPAIIEEVMRPQPIQKAERPWRGREMR